MKLSYTQTDYEFWFVAPAVTYQTIAPSPVLYDHMNQPIALYFATASGPAIVKIEQPANNSFTPIFITVTNTTAAELVLTSLIDSIENKPANTVLNRGLRITSDKPITAYYDIQSPHNAAKYTLCGRNALGTEFIIPSQNHYSNYLYTDPSAKNVFDIVASDDSTIVTIIPKSDLIGHAANDTFAIQLNRGQTWSGRSQSNDSIAHLGGSIVLADKPIAITYTDDAVFFPDTEPEAIDIAGDQLTPRHLAGTEFVMVDLGFYPTVPTRLLVYAFENSTIVNFKDSLQDISKTINRGEYAEFSIVNDSLAKYGGCIHSSKPVIVHHFEGSGLKPGLGPCPQAMMCIVPPIGCGTSKRVTFTRTPPDGMMDWWYWYIVTRNGDQGYFFYSPWYLNIPPSLFKIIPGTNGEYVGVSFSTNLPNYTNVTIWNTQGSFQLSESTTDVITSTVQYSKYSYSTNFSALYLGTDKKFCPGDSTLIDAGWGRDSYLWSTGDTTSSIWVKTPGTYWVYTTESGNCSLSDTVKVSYYYFTPVNLGPDRQICTGDSVLLDAGPGRAWYEWSTGDTTQTMWVKNIGTYWVKVPDVHCTVYDTITISTTPPPVVMNFPLEKSICSGQSTDIQLTSSLPGTIFHWTATLSSGIINGFSPDSGLVINQQLVDTLATPGIVTYHITPKAGLCMGDTVDFPVTVNPSDSVKVSITASSNNMCAGEAVTFTATPTFPGTSPNFQWKRNGLNAGTNSTVFTCNPASGDLICCILTSSATGCVANNPDTSNIIAMIVNPQLPVSVSVTASPGQVCTGTPVTFTANPVNPGTSPFFQWKLNGTNVGTNSAVFVCNPVPGDVVTCTLTSDALCATGSPATSAPVSVIVDPIVAVGVTIATPTNPFCPGNPVTITATPDHGGLTPVYLWKVNDIAMTATGPVYTYTPVNGDQVRCYMTSSLQCTTNNPAMSNNILLTENSTFPAGVNVTTTANPFCPGTSVTYTAWPTNGGTLPSFQWRVNGVNTGANQPTYTYSPQPGDSIRCIMTSNLSCVTGSPASSAKVIMSALPVPTVTFATCIDTITTLNAKPIKLHGGLPPGGPYTGPGVNTPTGVFTPSVAGIGTKTITYSYTNVASCSASKTKTITVQANSVFTCGNNLTDIRDNKVYPTVQIGTQCWMQANLDFGTSINDLTHQTDNCIVEKYTPNSSLLTPNSFYQWDEVMRYDPTPGLQGLCPPGWHVPDESEWTILFNYYQGNARAGYPLQDQFLNGFKAMQNGVFYLNSMWSFTDFATLFWSSTMADQTRAYAHGMNTINQSVSVYAGLKANGFSVRCLKD